MRKPKAYIVYKKNNKINKMVILQTNMKCGIIALLPDGQMVRRSFLEREIPGSSPGPATF